MHDKLFEAALGIGAPWAVKAVTFDEGARRLTVLIDFVPGSRLSKLYAGRSEATVNTIHHQAVNKLGRGLEVEAYAVPDDIVESIRWRGPSYVRGVLLRGFELVEHIVDPPMAGSMQDVWIARKTGVTPASTQTRCK